MSQKLATYGQWTYRGAWALEIAAAAIGLATGVALGVQAFQANQSVTAMDLALASAPFFMVAIAELTKIPIATLLFSVSWIWKPVILAFLLLLAGITFETVFMGMERAGAIRQLRYEELVNKIGVLENESALLASSDEQIRSTDHLLSAREELSELGALAEKERQTIVVQINEIDKELEGQTLLTPDAALARDQLREREERRASLVAERNAEAETAVARFERQRDSYVERIESARAAGDSASVRKYEAELAQLANPGPAIYRRYADRIDTLESEIAKLTLTFDKLRTEGEPMTNQQIEALQNRRTDSVTSLQHVVETWERQLQAARDRVSDAQTTESNKAQLVAANAARRDAIAKEISLLEAERVPLARTDQVRRIASRWYGKKPEEVTEDEEGLISVIWFSSLALIAALAGPITAMVALGLQKIATKGEAPQETKLRRLIRRMLLTWRWRRTRSVPRPVEVIIEREVEKSVEIPVEKVVKEILYVPILTDDPDTIRRALQRDLPPEVVDLVKLSAKGGHVGSAA